MAGAFDIVLLVGSLRKESLTRRLAHAAASLAPAKLRCEAVEVGALPLYDEDLDVAPPAAWTAFRDRLQSADGVMFWTPEYNRSIPGGLKNAIDVGSRPYGQSHFAGKPAAVVSQSPSAMGGVNANLALRHCLVFLDMPVLQQPEAYLANSGKAFADDGALDAGVRDRLEKLMAAYAAWVATIYPA